MDDDDIKTTEEALHEAMESILKIDETNWGPWKLDRDTRSVYMEVRPATYSLPVSELEIGAPLIDSIRQLCQKTWADNECLGGFVRAAFAIQSANGDPLHG